MEHQAIDAAPDALATYTPVTLRARRNGWTAERQRIFLTALSETGCISDACKAAGISARSAYRLRARADAESFADAWDEALLLSVTRLATLAFERATRGAIRELWKDGVLIAESRQPSDKLLMFLLQHLRAEWFRPKTKCSNSPALGAEQRYARALEGLSDNDALAEPLLMRDYQAEPPAEPIEPLGDEDEDW